MNDEQGISGNLLWPREKTHMSVHMKHLHHILKDKQKTNLSGRRILNWFFRITISSVQQYRWRCTSLEWIKQRSQAKQRPLLLIRNRLTESNHSRNSLYSSRWWLLVRTKVPRHLHTTFNESKPLSRLRNRHGPLLTIRVRFFKFLVFKDAFPISPTWSSVRSYHGN